MENRFFLLLSFVLHFQFSDDSFQTCPQSSPQQAIAQPAAAAPPQQEAAPQCQDESDNTHFSNEMVPQGYMSVQDGATGGQPVTMPDFRPYNRRFSNVSQIGRAPPQAQQIPIGPTGQVDQIRATTPPGFTSMRSNASAQQMPNGNRQIPNGYAEKANQFGAKPKVNMPTATVMPKNPPHQAGHCVDGYQMIPGIFRTRPGQYNSRKEGHCSHQYH